MAVRSLTGPGTPEARWRDAGVLDALPARSVDAVRPRHRAVVVAPHPDDEVLGLGGCLVAWAATGLEVLVVAVTDGEGSHPGSPTLTPADLAALRRQERTRALEVLGLPDVQVVELGLPDGAVAEHGDRVRAGLHAVLRDGDTLVAPVDGDGHPDHDASARAARDVADACGADLIRFAVWLWHWADPDEPGVDWTTAARVVLPAGCRDAKRAAVGCFTTQFRALSDDPRDAAVLSSAVLVRLCREIEILWGRP